MPHIIEPKECSICGSCEFECPTGAVSIDVSQRYYIVDVTLCNDCGDCVEVCPTEAISADAATAPDATVDGP